MYFLSDYDNLYPVVVKDVVAKIIIMKDFVHTIRQFYKDQKTAINKVKVNGISHLSKEKQKAIIDLKKSLLRKRMNKVLYKMKKGFKRNYASVGTIYIEGSLCELKDLSEQLPSLAGFYKKIEKFVKKYIDTWAIQMETSKKEGIPTSSNIVESKNSIFKSFIKKAKCFSNTENMEGFFAAVALFQNFDIKTRGMNKGTSAITRAGIDLNELNAKDFFEAIDLRCLLFKKSCIIETTIIDDAILEDFIAA